VQIAKLLADCDDEILDGLLDAVWELRLEPELARIAARLPKTRMSGFSDRLMVRGGEEFVAALRETALQHELDALSAALAAR
jgi:hypothetical protein